MCDMRALLGAEHLRRQELAEAELEKRELLELLRDLPKRSQPHTEGAAREPRRNNEKTCEWALLTESSRHLQREDTLHTSSLSLHSAQAINSAGPLLSPQLGDRAHRGGTRSLTLDCIKKKSREVTVIWVHLTFRRLLKQTEQILIFLIHVEFKCRAWSWWNKVRRKAVFYPKKNTFSVNFCCTVFEGKIP